MLYMVKTLESIQSTEVEIKAAANRIFSKGTNWK